MEEEKFGTSQKVVIVEDNEALSEIYKTRLEMLGYECHVAYDGIAAIELIKKEIPDLVLLDLMVPKMAGDQILERMRQSDWGKDIKVIIVSNLNEADAPAGLRNMGIEAYAVKANLTDNQIDLLVESILKPPDQKDDASLEVKDPQPDIYDKQFASQDSQQSTNAPTTPAEQSAPLNPVSNEPPVPPATEPQSPPPPQQPPS
jgi:CheY-like chemotaxis protein